MPLSQFLLSLRGSSPTAEHPAPRLEVCPPALGQAPGSQPVGLRAWLGSAWLDSTSATPRRAQRRPEQRAAPLAAVRAEFGDALAGLTTPRAQTLQEHIHKARTLRELWHLRADVYTLVATQCNEAEAQRRVQQLNRHFATRSVRPALRLF